jgi:hypothetical protein
MRITALQPDRPVIECPKTAHKMDAKVLFNQSDLKKNTYRYYPSCSVYFDIDRELFFTRDMMAGKYWRPCPIM